MKELLIFTLILAISAPIDAFGVRERIVGGNVITYDEAPTIASIQVRGYHFCGGTMLSQRYVLTAAHCTQYFRAHEFTVQIGSDVLFQGGRMINVTRIYRHPSYDRLLVDYDFSILYLESIQNFPSNVRFAKLPSLPSDGIAVGDQMYIIGWGQTLVASDNHTLLRRAIVPIIDMPTCKKNYAWAVITLRMVCAGYAAGKIDSCDGKMSFMTWNFLFKI
jgi:trypsin